MSQRTDGAPSGEPRLKTSQPRRPKERRHVDSSVRHLRTVAPFDRTRRMSGRYEGGSRWRIARLLLGAVSCVLFLAVDSGAGYAAPAAVVLDKGKPAFSKLETGGWAAKLGLANVTDGAVQLGVGSVRPLVTGLCTVQFETGPTVALQAAQHESVTVTYSQGCKIGKAGAEVRLTTNTTPPQSINVAVDPPTEPPQPDWDTLWAFAWALGASLIVLLIMLFTNEKMTFGTRLTHLPTTWSFKESWATNVTAGGGILAGIVGSTEVVKAFLGTEANSSIALAIVGAAVAVAFLTFGGLLVQTVKYTDSESPTAGGFVLGASCTLAGAFGELFTLYATGRKLDLGDWQGRLLPIVIVIGIVLAVYAVISVRATLEIGTHAHPPNPLSESTTAAVYIASQCCEGVDTDKTFRQIEAQLSPDLDVAKGARFKLRVSKEGTNKEDTKDATIEIPPPSPPKRVGAALL